MKNNRFATLAGIAAFTACSAAMAQVEFYSSESRINDPVDCAVFCCLDYPDPILDYQEAGLNVSVDDVAFKSSFCNIGNENYYPNGGVNDRITITRIDGADFGHLEFVTADGWGHCTIFVWVTAYLDGAEVGDYDIDITAGEILGMEGTFDEVRVGGYFDAASRDAHDEAGYNAIALDDMCYDNAGDCLDMAVSALVAGQTGTWDIAGADAGANGVVAWGLNLGETVVNGTYQYCATFGMDGVGQNRVVGFWTADADGNAQVQRRIPGNVSGLEVHTQAAQQGTCPDECMSAVDTQTIG